MTFVRRWWLGIGFGALLIAAVFTGRKQDEREMVVAELPELRLVTSGKEPYRDAEFWLYTGPGDADALAERMQKALAGREGWIQPKLRPGTPFPYRNFYEPYLAAGYLRRLMDRWFPLRSGPPLDVQVLRGRAGAKPEGVPWTTLFVRRSFEVPRPEMAEPVLGWGVRM